MIRCFFLKLFNKMVVSALKHDDQEGKFWSVMYSGLCYKSFTIVIYNRNDSGQYYKTTNDVRIVS
jgi:hypothetical protein